MIRMRKGWNNRLYVVYQSNYLAFKHERFWCTFLGRPYACFGAFDNAFELWHLSSVIKWSVFFLFAIASTILGIYRGWWWPGVLLCNLVFVTMVVALQYLIRRSLR